MNKFEIGKTYFTRSICDYDCVIKATVISRTAKTIRAKLDNGEVKTFRIVKVSEFHNAEAIKPWGTYSMSPTITANNEWKAA